MAPADCHFTVMDPVDCHFTDMDPDLAIPRDPTTTLVERIVS